MVRLDEIKGLMVEKKKIPNPCLRMNREKLETIIFDYFWDENVYEAQAKGHVRKLAQAINENLKDLLEVVP